MQEIEERFSAELIAVETSEGLICSLNDNQAKHQHQSTNKIKKLKRDYAVKIRCKEDLLKSKDERLKLLKDRECKFNLENEGLQKVVAAKEVEGLSMIEIM